MTDEKQMTSVRPQTIDGLMKLVSGNPGCKRANCHGKGYVGIRPNEDGSMTLLLCECAKMGQTEFAFLYNEINRIGRTVDTLAVHTIVGIDELKAGSLRGTLSRWRKRISGILTPAPAPPAPVDQAVPVTGEVKS